MKHPSISQGLREAMASWLPHEDITFIDHVLTVGEPDITLSFGNGNAVRLKTLPGKEGFEICFPTPRPPRILAATYHNFPYEDSLNGFLEFPHTLHQALPLWRDNFTELCSRDFAPVSFRMKVLLTAILSYEPKQTES
jgi:hypothetical protein